MVPFGYQSRCLDLLYNYDYSKHTPELLLSGSVGSAKSVLLAHFAISHCLRWPGARVAISRRSLPDLRLTIYGEIIEHMSKDFVENVHFGKRDNTCFIRFANGSEIIAVSFGDKKYSKVRSLKLSGVILEEGTDFDDEFYEEGGGFMLFKARLRRIFNVPENFLIVATNPDSPEHFLYRYFIQGEKDHESRYVFYSVTTDNPYLDPVYVRQLSQDYSKLEAERYLRGQWISIDGIGIYHAYTEKDNFKHEQYEIDRTKPLHVCYDFNVAQSAPMSAVVFQHIRNKYHVFTESIIDNSLWCLDCLEDLEAKGVLAKNQKIYIHGDASGSARSANSKYSNYDLIKQWLTNRHYTFEIKVPKANPPITTRHIKVNAMCKNDLGDVRLYVYKACPTLNMGLKLTKFKKGTRIEDEKFYQHCTTSLGYGIYTWEKMLGRIESKKKTVGSHIRT